MSSRDLIFTILGIDKGSKAFDEAGKSADKFGDKLNKVSSVGAKAMAAMPLAAAAAGVATAGSLALVGAGVIGLSALILHNNEQVSTAYASLWGSISAGATAAAQPLAGDLALAADKARFAVTEMTPEFTKLFSAAGPGIASLTGGVVGLAKNAMPGLVTAVQRSGPAFSGLESLLKSTGTGVSDFFTNISEGAGSSGQVMDSTGHIIRDLAGFAGKLFAQLSNTGSPSVMALENALRQAEGTILSLGAGAFPVLTNAASGFLTAGSGVLRLLQLVSPVIGPLIGDVLSFATSLKLVDMVSFGGVSAGLAGVKTAVGEAEGAGGKLKAGFGALATGPLPLLGIAAIGLSLLLDNLGKKQREAAEAAQIHDAVVRDLAGTLDKTSGSITDETRTMIANKIAKENVGKASTTMADQAARLGIAQRTVADAVVNTGGAMGRMDGSLRAMTENQIRATLTSEQLQQIHNLTGKSVQDLGTIYMGGAGGVDAFQNQLTSLEQTEGAGTAGLHELGTKMQGATLDSRNLWGGITELNHGLTDAQKQALQAAAATDMHAKAIAALRAQMEALVNKDLAYRDAIDATEKANKTAADALKAHGAKSEQYTDAVRGVEHAMISQAAAARDLGVANSASADQAGKATDGQKAYAHEIVNMATAAGKNAPPALRQMLSSLSDSDLAAQGASRSIDGTGQAVYRLPNGKTITISAQDDATFRAARISEYIQSLHDKWITIGINQVTTYDTIYRSSAPGSQPFSQGRAGGGWVTGPGTTTSDSIPMMLSNKEFVVNADDAARYGPVLEAINAGRAPAISTVRGQTTTAAGGVTNNYNLTVVQAGNSRIDLQKQFRAMELMSGVV